MSTSIYFTPVFVQQMMQNFMPAKTIVVSNITLIDVDNSASILAVLTSVQTEKQIGHFGMEVSLTIDGKQQTKQMVMKIKPHGAEIDNMLNSLAQACGGELAAVYPQFKNLTGFHNTHLKEQEIYSKLSPSFTPEIFGLYTNTATDEYIILMEYLQDVDLLNTVMEPGKWTDEHIKISLTQIAAWHSSMLNTTANLDTTRWNDVPSLDYMTTMVPLWSALLENAGTKCPELYNKERVDALTNAISNIKNNWRRLQTLPKTLIHNDCNPRNSCFKNIDGKLQLCLYDWELATFHIPQYDVVEFLCFVLDKDRYEKRSYYIEFYRKELHSLTGEYNDIAFFNEDLQLAALDFGIHRLGMYMMAHSLSPYPFLPRVVNSFFNTIGIQ